MKLSEPGRSLVLLLVTTGLRIGELLALRWRNVDLEARVLHVRETVYEGHFDTPKTQRSIRSVPLGNAALTVLRARLPKEANPDPLVFATRGGNPLDRRNLLRRDLQPACRALGLPPTSWHTLRHSNATFLDAVGAPLGTVQALLGHSTPEITRSIYVHAVPEDQRQAVENLGRLLFGPKWTQIQGEPKSGNTLIQ
jgi:integrase